MTSQKADRAMRPLNSNRFVCSGRVRFSELDPQRVVFYSRYLEYIDDAIVAYWLDRGIAPLPGQYDTDFQVKRVQVVYERPLRQDEKYDIGIVVNRIGGSSVTYEVIVYGNGGRDVCCVAEIVHVNVALATGKSVAVTSAVRDVLQRDVVT
jgi:acyl-CoA thioester hydrolase